MTTEVRVPTLGESVTEATVATWFKKPGDSVAVDEMLCELETDKVTVEVPSPAAGVLADIVANEGDTVGVDALLANIAEAGVAGSATPEERPSAKAAEKAEPSGGASVDVMVPTLGESVSEATVSTWFKAVGDTVAQDEMLCELETDKVSVEVPAPSAGVLSEITAPEGSTVEAGGKLGVIGGSAGTMVLGASPMEASPDPGRRNNRPWPRLLNQNDGRIFIGVDSQGQRFARYPRRYGLPIGNYVRIRQRPARIFAAPDIDLLIRQDRHHLHNQF